MLTASHNLTKKAKRELRKERVTLKTMHLEEIEPLTQNQDRAFQSWFHGQDLVLHGSAGTGKTLMALFFGLREVKYGNADKVLIVRSVVPSRDMGFLPGSEKEKTKQYEAPYYGICEYLFGRADAYEFLKDKGVIEFTSTSYLRGLTFDNTIVILDEMQNLAFNELHTVMSRIGEGCRIILSGDTAQSDLDERKGKGDICRMLEIIRRMECFDFISFHPEDVVRSGKARQYIIACEEMEQGSNS